MKNSVYKQNSLGLAYFVSDISNEISINVSVKDDYILRKGSSSYESIMTSAVCKVKPIYNVIHQIGQSTITILIPKIKFCIYMKYKNSPTSMEIGFNFEILQKRIMKEIDLDKESKDFYKFEKKLEKIVIVCIREKIEDIFSGKAYTLDKKWSVIGKILKINTKSEVII